MVVSSQEAEFRIDNPSALIRARIREKRIFEARFLCRQLGGELGSMEKNALEGELAKILAQVDKLRKQAIAHAAAGRLQLAAKVYREIERIAIDVPDVAAERQRIDRAEAMLVNVANPQAPIATAATASPIGVDALPGDQSVSAPGKPTRQLARARWWWSKRLLVLAGGVIVFIGLLLLLSHRQRSPVQKQPAAIKAPANRIVIQPMVSSASAPAVENRAGETENEVDPPNSGTLSIGELQVQPSHPK